MFTAIHYVHFDYVCCLQERVLFKLVYMQTEGESKKVSRAVKI